MKDSPAPMFGPLFLTADINMFETQAKVSKVESVKAKTSDRFRHNFEGSDF